MIPRWVLATAAVGGWVAAALLWRSVYLLRRALDRLVDALNARGGERGQRDDSK